MKRSAFSEQGFTLLEVLISLAILSIIFLGLGRLLWGSFAAVEESRDRLTEISQGQQEAEQEFARNLRLDNQIATGDSLEFSFVGDSDLSLEVEGGIKTTEGDLEIFLSSVATVEELRVDPQEHNRGNEPEEITINLVTSQVDDQTPAAVQLVSLESGGFNSPRVEETIESNQAQFTISLGDDQRPAAGLYSIKLWIDDLEEELNISRDYLIRPIQTVAVGEDGNILTTFQGDDWGQLDVGVRDLEAVTWGGVEADYQFVAVGEEGTVRTSEQGLNWERGANLPSGTNKLTNVIWAGDRDQGRFLVVGEAGTVWAGEYDSFSGGYEWESLTTEINNQIQADLTSFDLMDVAYGGEDGKEKIVLVDDEGQIIYGNDNNWERTSIGGESWTNATWGEIYSETGGEKSYFYLAGEEQISTFELNDQGDLIDRGEDNYNNPPPGHNFNGITVGQETIAFVGFETGNPREQRYSLYYYDDSSLVEDWAYSSFQLPVTDETRITEFKAATYNARDLFVIGNNDSGQPRIMFLTEQGWQPVGLESSQLSAPLNDLTTAVEN